MENHLKTPIFTAAPESGAERRPYNVLLRAYGNVVNTPNLELGNDGGYSSGAVVNLKMFSNLYGLELTWFDVDLRRFGHRAHVTR